VKKLAIAIALCGSLFCSPVYAKTFVGVLWPMFGPLPAIGLVELTGEIRLMQDVEVATYLHQEWPDLVDAIARQPPGTKTVVIGYSLGANASVFVANKSKYIDLIIALQPSMLSWNPAVTGKVGHYIEVYNPNPWMTMGGMGSKKLEGPNIEYIANNDSHPGAQFNGEFRALVKNEIAKLTAQGNAEIAQAEVQAAAPPQPAKPPKPPKPQLVAAVDSPVRKPDPKPAEAKRSGQKQLDDKDVLAFLVVLEQAANAPAPEPEPAVATVSDSAQPDANLKNGAVYLDVFSKSANSGNLPVQRPLTPDDMRGYAVRAYPTRTADNLNQQGY